MLFRFLLLPNQINGLPLQQKSLRLMTIVTLVILLTEVYQTYSTKIFNTKLIILLGIAEKIRKIQVSFSILTLGKWNIRGFFKKGKPSHPSTVLHHKTKNAIETYGKWNVQYFLKKVKSTHLRKKYKITKLIGASDRAEKISKIHVSFFTCFNGKRNVVFPYFSLIMALLVF